MRKKSLKIAIGTKSFIQLSLFLITPIIIIIITACSSKIKIQHGSLLINAYSILAGVFYFFKRLDFDKKCVVLRHKKDRLDQLKREINHFDELVRALIKGTFENTESLFMLKNKIQSVSATITTILEICEAAGDLEKNDTKRIIKHLSFVENHKFFIGNMQELSTLNKDDFFMRYGYTHGPVREIIYTSIVDVENSHLNI